MLALPFRISARAPESLSARNLAPQSEIFLPQRSSHRPRCRRRWSESSLETRAKPQGGGSIDNIAAVEIPDQHAVMGSDNAIQFRA